MDLLAISERIADTLRRNTALMAEVREVEWGSRAEFDYGPRFPLVRVSPGRVPVSRRELVGTGGDPDRIGTQATVGAFEVAIVTSSEGTSERAQRQAWPLARLVEAALAGNARLADADGAGHLAADMALGTVQRHGPNIGRSREAVTVMVTVTVYEDLTVLNTPEAAS